MTHSLTPADIALRDSGLTEADMRRQVLTIAQLWVGTPYVSNAMVLKGGVDCAMLLRAVYGMANLIPKDFDPGRYSPQWHLHRNEEKYLTVVRGFAHEVEAPPNRTPKPADVVLFKIGRLFAHGGIIVEWPRIIHARAPHPVMVEDISHNTTGKHALMPTAKLFFSPWID